MPDNLTIINRIIEEHHTIKNHMKLVGESMNDLEALFSLRQAYSSWAQGSIDALNENQEKLQQTLSALDEGLKNHFGFEERTLPVVLGTILMQALLLEHREIISRLEEAKPMLADTRLSGLKQEELFSQKSHIERAISDISRLVEEHTTREEIVLNMAKRALEEGK